MSVVDDMVRRLLAAEDEAITAAILRANAAGCGVKITRSSPRLSLGTPPFDRDEQPYRLSSTLTIEVSPDVPLGELHEHQGGGELPSVHSPAAAATEPHAMIDDYGELFYPDSEEDAYAFIELHGARYVHPNGGDWS